MSYKCENCGFYKREYDTDTGFYVKNPPEVVSGEEWGRFPLVYRIIDPVSGEEVTQKQYNELFEFWLAIMNIASDVGIREGENIITFINNRLWKDSCT